MAAKLCLGEGRANAPLKVGERRLILLFFGLGLIEGPASTGRGVDPREKVAGLDHWPSAKAILTIPSTRPRTVTVFSACAWPSPSMKTGYSVRVTAATGTPAGFGSDAAGLAAGAGSRLALKRAS